LGGSFLIDSSDQVESFLQKQNRMRYFAAPQLSFGQGGPLNLWCDLWLATFGFAGARRVPLEVGCFSHVMVDGKSRGDPEIVPSRNPKGE